MYAPREDSAETGYLLLVRDNTLMAQPFDANRAAFTGETFPLAEQIGNAGNQGNRAFFVSRNGVLAFTSGSANVTRELVGMDRNGNRVGMRTWGDRRRCAFTNTSHRLEVADFNDRRHTSTVAARWPRALLSLYRWTADGAAAVKAGSSFETESPRRLFDLAIVNDPLGRFVYQPTADGQRFLVTAPVGAETRAITVVLNWQAGVK